MWTHTRAICSWSTTIVKYLIVNPPRHIPSQIFDGFCVWPLNPGPNFKFLAAATAILLLWSVMFFFFYFFFFFNKDGFLHPFFISSVLSLQNLNIFHCQTRVLSCWGANVQRCKCLIAVGVPAVLATPHKQQRSACVWVFCLKEQPVCLSMFWGLNFTGVLFGVLMRGREMLSTTNSLGHVNTVNKNQCYKPDLNIL